VKITKKRQKSPQFAAEMAKAMNAEGINVKRLSAKIGVAYDPLRKVYNGDTFPGPNYIRAVSKYFKLDEKAMKDLVELDKMDDKGLIEKWFNEDPKIVDMKRYFKHLSEEEKDQILAMVKSLAALAISKARKS